MERNGLAGLVIGKVNGGGGVEERRSEDRTELLCSHRTSLCCCEEIWIITKLAKHEYPASNFYYKIFR